MMHMTYEADVVVLGSGMAGTTAALAAARRGASVVLVEKAAQLGGSARLSGGLVWSVATTAELRERAPEGDPVLQAALVANFPRVAPFVRQSGAHVSEGIPVMFGHGNRIDFLDFQRRSLTALERAGGFVALETEPTGLLAADGRVLGVRVRDAEGVTDVTAATVILATGGFQGNAHLMATFMGERATRLIRRSNTGSTGDGMMLARAVGAAIAGDMATYYGHLIPHPLPQYLPSDYLRFSVMFSDKGLLMNKLGERFTDEDAGYYRNAQRVAEQHQGLAVLVFDDAARQSELSQPFVRGGEQLDTFGDAHAARARTATQESLDDLARVIAEWGYPTADLGALADERAQAARARGLDRSIRRPPFHAIEVRPAITFTQGGLRVDADARVLDAAGEAIPGLYAAGADIGGIYNGGYGGGLALGGTFALLATDHALG